VLQAPVRDLEPGIDEKDLGHGSVDLKTRYKRPVREGIDSSERPGGQAANCSETIVLNEKGQVNMTTMIVAQGFR
jgi:hypothetical protein